MIQFEISMGLKSGMSRLASIFSTLVLIVGISVSTWAAAPARALASATAVSQLRCESLWKVEHAVRPVSELEVRQAEFRAAINRFETAKAGSKKADKALRATIVAAQRLLALHEVRYEVSPQLDVLTIATNVGTHRLNLLGRVLLRAHDGMTLVFDPRELKKQNAGALYDENKNVVFLSVEEILKGQITDYLVHELRHADTIRDLLRGASRADFGWVLRDATLPEFNSTYGREFSLDELPSYAIQLRFMTRNWRKQAEPSEKEFEDVQHLAQMAQELVSGVIDVLRPLSKLSHRLQLPNTNPTAFTETRVIGDKQQEVTGLRLEPGHEIFYYLGPAVERLPSHLITYAVLQNPERTVRFLFSGHFSKDGLGAWNRKVHERVQEMLQRAERGEKLLSDLQGAVVQKNPIRAREIAADLHQVLD